MQELGGEAPADHRIAYVERVFEFFFEGTFATQVRSQGLAEWHLHIWHLNAQSFSRLTLGTDLSEQQKFDLLTLLESARFCVLAAEAVPGFEPGFSFEGYEMPADFKDFWGDRIVAEVLASTPPGAAPPLEDGEGDSRD